MSSNLNNTSSKPIKKMVLWTRVNNSKSASPHLKDNSAIQQKSNLKTAKDGKKVKENMNICQNEKKVLSPTMKAKDLSTFSKNRTFLNYTRLTTNKKLNSQGGSGSFQSNSNEEERNSSKHNESSHKKKEKDSQFINNIKYKKNININYSPNDINTNNINSSEFHINNTYKYFQSTNEINLKKKENKSNCITDNNIAINQSKNIITKKKISLDKDKKKLNNSKKKISLNNNNQISPTTNKIINSFNMNNNINHSLNNHKNISYTVFNQCKRNVNSISSTQKLNKNTYNEILNDSNSLNNKKISEYNANNNKNNNLDKIKNLELENKKLKKENYNLVQKNKELKILVNKLENEIVEIKSVIKDNLNQFIEPQNDLMNKTYKQFMDQIEKQKLNLTKILNYQKDNSTVDTESKTKEENNNNNNNNNKQKIIISDERNNYRVFKKNFFEFFNHVNTSNSNVNGYPTGSDPLKTTLNSFCCFMDNIMNKLEEKFINVEKKESKNKDNNNADNNCSNNNNSYINNFTELCLINLYYEYMIMQLFIVSFFERQHCYYCYSILDYILISPFNIIKNNNYIKEYIKKINNVIEIYKKINEEYINRFTEQNIFYLDNYIKLFNIAINNKISLSNSIKIDNEIYKKNTNILFNNDKQTQNIYLDMINNLLEKIQKNGEVNQSIEKIFDQNKNKGKNKINMIKITGDNLERISNISNCSSRIIDNYSEKPSFYGFLKNDDVPPDMSFGDEDL